MEVITTILKFAQVKAFLAVFIFVTIFLISTDKSRSQGPYEGIVKKADNYYTKMNNSDKDLYACLLDEKLKVIHDSTIVGEVKLFFADSVTLNGQLKPYPEGAFAGDAASAFY
ncbi:MAG: hypothetical protein HYU69_09095 [Bacteroidetes bacterium]|nr:hypothetical protein [Bacteroidota bacterium]